MRVRDQRGPTAVLSEGAPAGIRCPTRGVARGMVIASGPKIAQPRTSPKDVLDQAKDLQVKMVDFKFIDLPGLWQHFSIPVEEFNESLFSEGIGFDGSSIRGFQKINESDMLLLPDADTAFLDPACTIPTLSIICDVIQPGS